MTPVALVLWLWIAFTAYQLQLHLNLSDQRVRRNKLVAMSFLYGNSESQPKTPRLSTHHIIGAPKFIQPSFTYRKTLPWGRTFPDHCDPMIQTLDCLPTIPAVDRIFIGLHDRKKEQYSDVGTFRLTDKQGQIRTVVFRCSCTPNLLIICIYDRILQYSGNALTRHLICKRGFWS